MIDWRADVLREYLGSWTTEELIILRDRNDEVAVNHQTNADKMREIVRVMDEVIRERKGQP